MSHLVSSFVPKSFIFLYDGSGGFISLGISQSWSDQIILSSGFTNGGGGGGGGGLLSGASPHLHVGCMLIVWVGHHS